MNDKALPAWDLSDLYDGIEDEKIAADLEKYRAFCVEFAGRYKGRLSELDGAGIAAALKAYEQNSEIGSRVGGFAYLNMVTQMKNQAAVAFYQNISEKLTDYGKPVILFELELNRLPAATLKEWLKNKKVDFYKLRKEVSDYRLFNKATCMNNKYFSNHISCFMRI